MTDKEEKITIHQVLYPCKKCSINCNKNDWKNCDFYQNYISGMTRQEAIERMAKAIFKRDSVLALDIGFENLIEQKQNIYRDFAEIALNALLEDNNVH